MFDMNKLIKTLAMSAMLIVCVAPKSWAVQLTGGSLSGTVAEYNAAQVRNNQGVVTVPKGMVTYTANTALPVGTTFVVTLPSGFKFATTTQPSLSNSAASFVLLTYSGQTAKFTVATAAVPANSTIVLGSYTVTGASALETIIPAASALPLTMQAIGIDPQPLSFPEFASDSGIQAVFVGAIQFIDLNSPSNGTEFGTGLDSPTAVLSAIAISPEISDSGETPILSPDGNPNTLASSDTAKVVFPGVLYQGITVFSSSGSACTTTLTKGTVTSNALIFFDVPINTEVFFCATATGKQEMKILGYPSLSLGITAPGFVTVELLPSTANADFSSSTNVNVEFPGLMCYGYGSFACTNPYFSVLDPIFDFDWGKF
jgi:hypothetical protein